MRKLWYAGAIVAGGFFLFGAAVPAQADLLPGTGTAEQQADERLADLLGQSNGINVENPLRYSTMGTTPLGTPPVLQFKPGQNTPDLNPALPGESTHEPRPDLPAADVVGGALQRPSDRLPVRNMNIQQLPLQGLPGGSLLGGLLGGALPNGGTPGLLQRPTARQAEAFDGGLPLLGGLGGLLPVNQMPRPKPNTGDTPDTSGLPAGGVALVPAAMTPPTFGQSAASPAAAPAAASPAAASPAAASSAAASPAAADKPAAGKPQPAATPDDPRLHEEPIDSGEAAPQRAFSPNGRPVAGVDQQYK